MSDVITYSVDGITEDMAVLVDDAGNRHPVALALLPAAIRCGDILLCERGKYRPAPQLTEERRAHVLSLQEKLRRRAK